MSRARRLVLECWWTQLSLAAGALSIFPHRYCAGWQLPSWQEQPRKLNVLQLLLWHQVQQQTCRTFHPLDWARQQTGLGQVLPSWPCFSGRNLPKRGTGGTNLSPLWASQFMAIFMLHFEGFPERWWQQDIDWVERMQKGIWLWKKRMPVHRSVGCWVPAVLICSLNGVAGLVNSREVFFCLCTGVFFQCSEAWSFLFPRQPERENMPLLIAWYKLQGFHHQGENCFVWSGLAKELGCLCSPKPGWRSHLSMCSPCFYPQRKGEFLATYLWMGFFFERGMWQ